MLIEHLHGVSFRWYTQALSDNLVDSSLPQMCIQCLVCVPDAILGAWSLSGNRRDKKAISDSLSLDSSVCGEGLGWGFVHFGDASGQHWILSPGVSSILPSDVPHSPPS